MKKFGLICCAGLFATNAAVHAEIKMNCMPAFHVTKDMTCIDMTMQLMNLNGATSAKPDVMNAQAVAGFLAVVLRAYPENLDRIERQAQSPLSKRIVFEALYLSGLKGKALTYASENNLDEEFKMLAYGNVKPIEQIMPGDVPAENDLIIGAYMGSGDVQYIKHMLENFKSADDRMTGDGIRAALMLPMLQSPSMPQARKDAFSRGFCDRYACKTDVHQFMRVATLETAFWAVTSLGKGDPTINKAAAEFFLTDPRLNRIVAAEMNAFSNYVTLSVALTGMQGEQPSGTVVKNLDLPTNYVALYETFGSPKDLNALLAKAGNR